MPFPVCSWPGPVSTTSRVEGGRGRHQGKPMRPSVLAAALLLPLTASAVTYHQIPYKTLGGEAFQWTYTPNFFGSYSVLQHKISIYYNLYGSVAWTRKTETFYDPPYSAAGFSMTKQTVTVTGQRQPGTEAIAQPCTISYAYEGSNPLPNKVVTGVTLAPTGIAPNVGMLTEQYQDKKVVYSLPFFFCRLETWDGIALPMQATAHMINNGTVTTQSASVDYSTRQFRITSPFNGLWEVFEITLTR